MLARPFPLDSCSARIQAHSVKLRRHIGLRAGAINGRQATCSSNSHHHHHHHLLPFHGGPGWLSAINAHCRRAPCSPLSLRAAAVHTARWVCNRVVAASAARTCEASLLQYDMQARYSTLIPAAARLLLVCLWVLPNVHDGSETSMRSSSC